MVSILLLSGGIYFQVLQIILNFVVLLSVFNFLVWTFDHLFQFFLKHILNAGEAYASALMVVSGFLQLKFLAILGKAGHGQ